MLCKVVALVGITKIAADGLNPMSHPAADETVQVGIPYTIEWSAGTPGPVFICIYEGADGALENVTGQYSVTRQDMEDSTQTD